MTTNVVILSAGRTPIGAFQGVFATLTAAQLGSAAIRAAVKASEVRVEQVDEVILGSVLTAGQGQAPARQAAIGAGLPHGAPATTINKICGSGMKAVMLASDQLSAGGVSVMVAGGFESMSQAPYLLPKARSGYRLGHGEIIDHMFLDGLQNPYDGKLMGHFADATALRYGFTREQQDEYVSETVRRAQTAVANGAFIPEIAPVSVKTRDGEEIVHIDETPGTCNLGKIARLRPAFSKDGTVTAASSSSIADGASALVLSTAPFANKHGLHPVARIVAHSSHAQAPEWFTTAPVGAIKKVLERSGWDARSVDLYEINEAFACVPMVAIQELGLDGTTVNVNGGSCAMGHPIGASGARILVTLLHALQARGLRRGVASLCIGGGEATAMAIEML